MRKLSCMAGARFVAFMLLCVLLPVTVLSAAGYLYCYLDGWYVEGAPSFAASEMAEAYVDDYSQSICMHIGNHHGDLSTFQRDSLSFVVRDAQGGLICDTRGKTAERCMADEELIVGIKRVENDGFYYYFNDYSPYDTYDEVYTFEVYFDMPIDLSNSACWSAYCLYDLLCALYRVLLPAAVSGAALMLALFIFLMISAGRYMREDGCFTIELRGLDRVPVDIFVLICAACVLCCIAFADSIFLVREMLLSVIVLAITLFVGSLFVFGLCLSLAARFKAGKWWRSSVIFLLLNSIRRAARFIARSVPMMWKTVLIFMAFTIFNILCSLAVVAGLGFMLLVMMMADAAALLFLLDFTRQLRELEAAGKALSSGDLEYNVDTAQLKGELKAHGENLNSLSAGMARAVNERMKSERFKTELITNVSHDLKTPLTSIVSYVDLLKSEHIESEKAAHYIEVLDRQSAKLKKLTEDLVEASKASSGAISVCNEQLNVSELLNQSAGEYAESFRSAGLFPIISLPETEPIIYADGRLLWRVFDNILQNACKYALPGTRFYMSLTTSGSYADITFKNISREELNISADELLERFTRGDSSRSTEGSGLGLAIANSLTELMGGRLSISLDGDLFKIVLRFPTV